MAMTRLHLQWRQSPNPNETKKTYTSAMQCLPLLMHAMIVSIVEQPPFDPIWVHSWWWHQTNHFHRNDIRKYADMDWLADYCIVDGCSSRMYIESAVMSQRHVTFYTLELFFNIYIYHYLTHNLNKYNPCVHSKFVQFVPPVANCLYYVCVLRK